MRDEKCILDDQRSTCLFANSRRQALQYSVRNTETKL